jgi:hypothetical protein
VSSVRGRLLPYSPADSPAAPRYHAERSDHLEPVDADAWLTYQWWSLDLVLGYSCCLAVLGFQQPADLDEVVGEHAVAAPDAGALDAVFRVRSQPKRCLRQLIRPCRS